MINVGHVNFKVALKVLEDAHSKSNTHRVLEFYLSSTKFFVNFTKPKKSLNSWKFCC